MESRILVTGGTGYLGGVLVTQLLARGKRVRTFDSQLFGNALDGLPGLEQVVGDVRDISAVQASMENVDAVCHLCGIVTDHLVDMNPPKGYAVNVEGTANVVSAATAANVSRFIYVSSSSVYGWAAETFEDVDEWITPRPKTAYALQKLRAEEIVRDGFGAPQGTYCIVRPATMCGPAPRPRLDPLINVFSKQAYFDRRITVHGGQQWRSNVHVMDTAEVLLMLLDAPADRITGGIFNITAGNLTVGAAAEMVANAYERRYGKPVSVEYQRVADARSYRLTARTLREAFGWHPKRTMEDAINEMFTLFETGSIDPTNKVYFNTERMREFMKA